MKENATKRKKFLDLIAAGHDPEAAAVGAALPLAITKRADLQTKIQDALRVGTARIRSELTRLALADGDARTLEGVLSHRMSQVDSTEVTRIERVIVRQGKCEHCGHSFVEPASVDYHKRVKLSDPPAPVDDAAPSTEASTEASTNRTTGRRTAIMELVQGGNTVVEIPSTDQRRTYGASKPYPFHST